MLVHACGDGTECLELRRGRLAAVEVRLGASQPFEQDHVSLAKFWRCHGDDSFSVGRADHARSLHDAVRAERLEPAELGLDLGACGTQAGAAQGSAAAGGIVDAERLVLGDVAERATVAIESERSSAPAASRSICACSCALRVSTGRDP